MEWVKLLTEFDGHPKVLAVGLAGAGLYARSIAYAGKYETDGDIPEAWVAQTISQDVAKGLALAKALVEQGLWRQTEGGYQVVGFTAINKTAAEMKRLRKSRANAGRKGGVAKAKANAVAKAKQTNSSSNSNSISTSKNSKYAHYDEKIRRVK